MRKIIPILCILLITMTATIGCYPGDTAAPKTSTVQADIDKVKAELSGMAGTVNGLVPRVTTLEGRPSGGKDYSAEIAALTTKVTDAQTSLGKLEARIKILEDWKTAGGSGGSSLFGSPVQQSAPITGQVTWASNPTVLPNVFSGVQSITATDIVGGTSVPAPPNKLATFNIIPTGYVQPYTMRITNGTSTIQYVKPVINISQSTQGGTYYGNQYPQVIYYSLTVSSGYGMVQGTAISNFYQKTTPTSAGFYEAGCIGNAYNGLWYPSSFGTFNPSASMPYILQNGWWLSSSTNIVSTATGGSISGAFPINISPSNTNVQPTPSITLTTAAPALNGFGEFQLTPGQTMDMTITLQIATLQQASLTITNSISSRQ